MEDNLLEIIRKINNMEEDNLFGQMVENILEIGWIENNKDMKHIIFLINNQNMVCGLMEKELNG